jgi:outer membrane receptor protein involved in Fe transport
LFLGFKEIFMFAVLLYFFCFGQTLPSDSTLTGTVLHALDHQPIPHATVTLVNLKRVTTTDAQGAFLFTRVPSGTYTLGIHADGFGAMHPRVQVPSDSPLVFHLRSEVHVQDEITVTAAPWAIDPLNTAQSVAILETKDLSLGATSLGEALDGIPGVTTIGTGDNLGTPVIRGLSENRIKILNDRIGVNHHQFSFRHSPNIEPSFADKIEVVKGPQSVLYGSDAMGGVIHLIGKPLPHHFSEKAHLSGSLSAGLESNGDRTHWEAAVQGGKGSVAYRFGVVDRQGDDIKTPEATLDNTDFSQTNFLGQAGMAGSWGHVAFKASHWENETGFLKPAGFRLSLEDDLYALEGFFPTAQGDFTVDIAEQTNLRLAYPAELNGQPSVNLKLITQTVKTQWQHDPKSAWGGEWNGIIALEWVTMDNTPRAMKKLLPEYESDTWALVLFEEWTLHRSGKRPVTLAVGLRSDQQSLEVAPDPSRNLPNGWSDNYGALTGSLGLVVPLGKHTSAAFNLGRGWRAPNAFELFANGIHGGVSAIQLGNPDLQEETNLNAEGAIRHKSDTLAGSLTLFHSRFDRYIHLFDTLGVQNNLPVFAYAQADATLQGLEFDLEWAPRPSWQLLLTYSALETENRSTGTSLPQEPANRGTLTLNWKPKLNATWRQAFIALKSTWVGSASISGPDEPFGTPTDAYHLIHLHTGIQRAFGPGNARTLRLGLEAENLADTTYRDFLYPYKAWADNPGRSIHARLSWTF